MQYFCALADLTIKYTIELEIERFARMIEDCTSEIYKVRPCLPCLHGQRQMLLCCIVSFVCCVMSYYITLGMTLAVNRQHGSPKVTFCLNSLSMDSEAE